MMKKTGIRDEDITSGGTSDIDEKIFQAYPAMKREESLRLMAEDLGIGIPTLRDIIE